ncbi:MAG: hypothetical protein CMM02_02890 [Rhodopirellula sp.]|jgi:hypothetical protein|nr:hypothetical protein [Rhodopirellula sp.]|tara:strand:+ start:13959 stop:14954 length:996 start_codon:yes stop_codon:yes gene_type:complete
MASTKIQVPSNAVAKTYTWPATDGSNGQHLTTNGSGELSWATAASGGEQFISSLDYTNTLPPNAAQKFDFVVPTSKFTDDGDTTKAYKITRFKVKFKNLTWSVTANHPGVFSGQIRLFASAAPLNASSNLILSSNNNYVTQDSWQYTSSGGQTWNDSYTTTSSGNAGTYSRSGGNPTNYPRSSVGYVFVRSNQNLYAYNGNAGFANQIRQGVDKVTRTDNSRMNGFRANFNGELVIQNYKNQWDMTFEATTQDNSNSNTGQVYVTRSRNVLEQSGSTWYESNTAPAQGVRLYFLPHEFSSANDGTGSANQIEASYWGLSGGTMEFYADISD